MLLQARPEEEAIEKELEKIDTQFKCYNRQIEKEKPAEDAAKKLVYRAGHGSAMATDVFFCRLLEESSKSISASDSELPKDKAAQQVVVEAEVSAVADVNGTAVTDVNGTAVTAEAKRAESEEVAADISGSAMKDKELTEKESKGEKKDSTTAVVEDRAVPEKEENTAAGMKDEAVPKEGEGDATGGVREKGEGKGEGDATASGETTNSAVVGEDPVVRERESTVQDDAAATRVEENGLRLADQGERTVLLSPDNITSNV